MKAQGAGAQTMRAIQQAILDAVSRLPATPGAILDIGCGDGVFTRELARALPGANIIGIDPVLSTRSQTSSGVRFVRATVEQLPFAGGEFAVAVASLSFHHWQDKAAGIREAFRVLRPGGRLVIGDPLLEGWLGIRFCGLLMQKLDGGVFSTGDELEGYLKTAGFASVEVRLVAKTMKSLYLVQATKPGLNGEDVISR